MNCLSVLALVLGGDFAVFFKSKKGLLPNLVRTLNSVLDFENDSLLFFPETFVLLL